jgi:hypothetical protein
MADSSPQSTLLKSIGAFGGVYTTGVSLNTGDYMAIKALGSDVTVLGETVGNINDISGAIIPQGDLILGEFSVVNCSGDAVIYKS